MKKDVTLQCPHCGNTVNGTIVRSAGSKAVRTLIKKGGMKAVLTSAGSVIPGFGNVAGFVAGTVIDAAFGEQIGEMVDKVTDNFVEDNMYSFSCPNCDYTWVSAKPDDQADADDEKSEDPDSYYSAKREACIAFYVFWVFITHNAQEKQLTEQDYAEIINQIYGETGVTIKRQNLVQRIGHEMSYIVERLSENLPFDIKSWQSLETFMETNKQERDFSLIVETLYNDSSINAVFGFIESGSVSVGDTVILQGSDEDDNETRWTAKITWIEWNGELYHTVGTGCFIGLGIDIDTRNLPEEAIYGAIKEGEFTAELSRDESEYANELEALLEEGDISSRERRLLEKMRIKLGISEQRAMEIEQHFTSPSLTEDEIEYLDEYRKVISEGEISPRDQRFLDKLKKVNNISEARAKELESFA